MKSHTPNSILIALLFILPFLFGFFYFENFDPEQMAKDVEAGLNRYSDQQVFYQTELKKQAARFNWTRAAQEYLDVYKTLR